MTPSLGIKRGPVQEEDPLLVLLQDVLALKFGPRVKANKNDNSLAAMGEINLGDTALIVLDKNWGRDLKSSSISNKNVEIEDLRSYRVGNFSE